MKLLLTSALALLIILPAYVFTANAKEISNTEEEHLNAIFTEFVTKIRENAKRRGAVLNTKGTMNIEKAKGYYAVTLPEMRIIDADDSVTTIGMIAINASPTEKPKNWKMAVALPMPIVTNDKQGEKINQIDIGKQQFIGIYDEDIKNFSKLAVSYDDVKFSDYIDNVIIDTKNMSIISDLQIANKTLSGPTDIVLKNITLADTDTNKITTIKEIEMVAEYDGLDIISLVQDNYNFDFKKLGGIKLKGEVKDIESDFKLSKIEFEYDGEKPKNGISDQKVKIQYDGLKSIDKNQNMVEFIPTDMNLNFDFNKLPIEQLIKLGQMKNSSEKTPSAAMNMLQMMTSLPIKMTNAGTNIQIDNFDFRNEMYSIITRGNLKADAESPLMMIGNIDLETTGLDKTETALNAKLPNASKQERSAIQQAINKINFVQSKCAGKNGSYKCNLVANKEGKIMLNKTEITMMEALQLIK